MTILEGMYDKKSAHKICSDILDRFSLISTRLIRVFEPTEEIVSLVNSEIEEWKRRLAGPFYEKVSTAEKQAIFKAMQSEFSGSPSGHWYECPNGHTYTIGNCGLANQASLCPECGAPVGGTSYTLEAANPLDGCGSFEVLRIITPAALGQNRLESLSGENAA